VSAWFWPTGYPRTFGVQPSSVRPSNREIQSPRTASWAVTDRPVTNWESAAASDTERFGRFFQALLANGVYLPPSQFEACFVSTEHREAEIAATLEAVEKAFR
jgi:glutamate-1-semialdehyde aminotransferase